jgi:hypothetical protein
LLAHLEVIHTEVGELVEENWATVVLGEEIHLSNARSLEANI